MPGAGLVHRTEEIEKVCEIIRRKDVVIDCVTMEAAFCEAAVESPEYYAELLMGAVDAAVAVGANLVNHYCYYINLDEKPDFERMESFWGRPLAYAEREAE